MKHDSPISARTCCAGFTSLGWIGWFWPVAWAGLVAAPLVFFFAGAALEPRATVMRLIGPAGEAARLGYVASSSLGLAAMTATLALAMALIVFVAGANLSREGRRALWVAAAAALVAPGHFLAIGWIQTIGQAGWLTQRLAVAGIPSQALPDFLYSMPGCAFVMALHWFPVALGAVAVGWRTASAPALDAARTYLPPAVLWRKFLGGWMRRWLAAWWLLVLVMALLDYSMPFMLRRHVFSVEIMSAFSLHYDPAAAAALAAPLVCVSLIAAALLALFLRRAPAGIFEARGARMPRLPWAGRLCIFLGAASILAGALGVPLATLFKMAAGVQDLRTVVDSAASQVGASLLWSALAVAGTLAFGVGLATRQMWRRSQLAQRTFAVLMLAALALPSSIMAIALIGLWNRPGVGAWVYDSGAMLVIGLVAVFLPIPYFFFRGRLREISRTLIEMERLAPCGPWRRWWRLTAPSLARPAAAAAGLVFVLAMQEAQASVLLAAPGQETMAVRAMTLLHYAPDSYVAVYCLMGMASIGAGLAALGAAYMVGGNLWNSRRGGADANG